MSDLWGDGSDQELARWQAWQESWWSVVSDLMWILIPCGMVVAFFWFIL